MSPKDPDIFTRVLFLEIFVGSRCYFEPRDRNCDVNAFSRADISMGLFENLGWNQALPSIVPRYFAARTAVSNSYGPSPNPTFSIRFDSHHLAH